MQQGSNCQCPGLGVMDKQLVGFLAREQCPCHWPSASEASAQETLVASYLAAQCNLIINLDAIQQSIKSRPIPVV